MSQAINVINLPVITESGNQLGRVVGVEIDDTGRQVRFYQVSSALPLVKLWGEKLLISPDQVISISQKEIVVSDSFSHDLARVGHQPKLMPEATT